MVGLGGLHLLEGQLQGGQIDPPRAPIKGPSCIWTCPFSLTVLTAALAFSSCLEQVLSTSSFPGVECASDGPVIASLQPPCPLSLSPGSPSSASKGPRAANVPYMPHQGSKNT